MSERAGGDHVDSWYAASAPRQALAPALTEKLRCDTCILGGGYTGLSTALELAEAGQRVALLEAHRVGWGASGRNGGQAIFGYSCEPAKLRELLGAADARRVFDWSLQGLDLIHERSARFGIDCHWQPGHAHVPIRERQVRELRAWQEDLQQHFDYPLQWWQPEQQRAVLASDRYRGALYDPRSGHLHPLLYAQGLARAARERGVQIFEASRVQRVERGSTLRFVTDQGEVESDFGVLAGNAHVRGIATELDSRIMPVGSYIAVTEPLGEARARALIGNDMAVADINWALDYFRLTRDHRLLFGGRASYSTLPPPSLRRTMAGRIRRVFPQLGAVRLEHCWGGLIDISLNRAPHWGRLGGNLYFAQGFSGHGINTTQLAGRLIAEAIRGQSERLDVFARIQHRPFPGGRLFRTPALVLAMAWYKLRDALY